VPTAAGVALTFDDGPDPRWTPLVLEELGRARAVATFFVLSARAAAQRPTLERIVREGHEIGLHGNLHLRHDEHPAETIATDTEEALALLAPHRPRVWRPPHGIVGESTRALAARHSLRLVTWTADSVDWQAGASAAAMLASLEPQLSPGAVVLMHDAIGPGATRTTPQATVELVEPLVAAIRRRGLEPVRLDPAGAAGVAPARR
jgi:peptidoglycan/xylan/chitin deacetylase (PgdA/CDA1 family)